MKAQAATEYVILLAALALLSLLAIGTAAGFSGKFREVSERDSAAYWAGSDPEISVTSYFLSSKGGTAPSRLYARNNLGAPITVREIIAGDSAVTGSHASPSFPLVIHPGETVPIEAAAENLNCGFPAPGDFYSLAVTFTYSIQGNSSLRNFTGSFPLAGACQ